MELVVQEGRVHLNAVNVDNVMVDCIMGNSRNSDGESITVEGIVSKYALSKVLSNAIRMPSLIC